jgi:hypothetical protein
VLSSATCFSTLSPHTDLRLESKPSWSFFILLSKIRHWSHLLNSNRSSRLLRVSWAKSLYLDVDYHCSPRCA